MDLEIVNISFYSSSHCDFDVKFGLHKWSVDKKTFTFNIEMNILFRIKFLTYDFERYVSTMKNCFAFNSSFYYIILVLVDFTQYAIFTIHVLES